MPNIDIKIISDAGHGMSMDQPEIVNKSILNFLNK
jgi:pimeloyl-ACP methyl ester carboxylesterase